MILTRPMEELHSPLIKLTEHIDTTNKLIPHKKFAPRVIRIVLTDAYATDSSDDESGHRVHRVRRLIEEIKFTPSSKQLPPKVAHVNKKKKCVNDASRRKKFRGVRQRPWGRWAAEIRDPTQGKRVWLGTYDTPEEAAAVYDRASVRLKGPTAVVNFPEAAPSTESTTESEAVSSGNDAAFSPTSVLRYEECRPFDGLELGDFGFDFNLPLTVPELRTSVNFYGEEFGEFDFNDFINDLDDVSLSGRGFV